MRSLFVILIIGFNDRGLIVSSKIREDIYSFGISGCTMISINAESLQKKEK